MSALASAILTALEKGLNAGKIYLLLRSEYSDRELADAFLEILDGLSNRFKKGNSYHDH